ncbi:MAG: T9SS type A sorting domain-containing protein [Bacteroidales bacterium]|nr:T9SS type A sorting domain-containing protein [Bacteroidales bacterium]
MCDSGNASEWTDTIHFGIPGSGGGDATIDEDVIGLYTHLMPNPAGDRVNLISSFRMRKVELFNMDGKRIACYEANGLSTILDLSGYASGTYIVRIITQSGVTTKRMIKK